MPKRPKPRVFQPLSRQELYELAWKEPMVRLAERFGVSSSYLARVYTELKVPRPDRGYWAKLEFGKSPPKPSLPAARPGDLMQWAPGTTVGSIIASRGWPSLVSPSEPASRLHDLLVGIRPLFLKTRNSDDGILRPFKKTLVDILASKSKLNDAIDTAQVLFLALNQKGFHVGMAASDPPAQREKVFLPEKPALYPRPAKWSPNRPTIAHVRGAEIGLTLFEMTEEVEMVYIEGGVLVPVGSLSQRQLACYTGVHNLRTTRPKPSGRLCLQAYCPHRLHKWSKQWREEKSGELRELVPAIVSELETAASEILAKSKDAQARHDATLRKWDEEQREKKRRELDAYQRKIREDSRADLLSAIAAWDEARRVRAFLDAIDVELESAPEAEAHRLRERLHMAVEVLGDSDPTSLLKAWKSPSERLS